MKHFKLKMTLITVFILITAAVCCAMVFHLPPASADTREGITELLAQRDITTDADAFNNISYVMAENAVLENALSDRERLARAILGESANALPSASNIFMLNNQNVVFSGNSFHFENNEQKDEYHYPQASTGNAESTVEQIAQKLGIDIKESIIESSEDGENITYKITKTINGAPVYNDVLTIVITNGYIGSLDGIWFTLADAADSTGNTARAEVNINNALIEFMNMPDVPKPAHITNIETGYRLTDETKQSAPAQPVCKITLDDGTVYYIDL